MGRGEKPVSKGKPEAGRALKEGTLAAAGRRKLLALVRSKKRA